MWRHLLRRWYIINHTNTILLMDKLIKTWFKVSLGKSVFILFITNDFFSKNNLETIDKSIRLAPNLTDLNLSYNSIVDIANLTGLPHLRNIDLSHNNIKDIESLHTKIGQILTLDLSHNMIRNLHGMSKLYSVINLDVSNNKLRTLADVSTVTEQEWSLEMPLKGLGCFINCF